MNNFDPLLADYLDGELSSDGFERLSSALRNDANFRRQFVIETHTHRQLRDALGIEDLGTWLTDCNAGRNVDLPALEEFSSATMGMDSVSSAKSSVKTNSSLFWSRIAPAVSHSAAASIAIVATLFYGTFAMLVWNLRPSAAPLVVVEAPPAVAPINFAATLTSARDCRWEQPHEIGDKLLPTDLHLLTGIAEITFADGALVVLEGPAHFAIETAACGYLHEGKLVARVPRPAVGFAIQTATAKIVDLGTEFAVEADGSGATTVEVITGKIALTAEDATRTALLPPRTMVAGTACRLERANDGRGAVVLEVAARRAPAVPPARPSEPARIMVSGAQASSEFPLDRNVNYLINGRGLTGDEHSNDPAGTMWHSAMGQSKNEFVLFDLGRRYRIDSLKVWNYNEAAEELYKARGAKAVNVFVSETGKGTPLSHPDQWRLVKENVSLQMADGTDHYDTPDVIQFASDDSFGEANRGATGRFAAIVILDCFADDPRELGDESKRCVGLSEVQFFGENLNPSRLVK